MAGTFGMWYVFHRRESMCLLGEELHKLINLNGHVSTHWEAKTLGLPSRNGICMRLCSGLAMNRGHYQAATLPSIESCAQAKDDTHPRASSIVHRVSFAPCHCSHYEMNNRDHHERIRMPLFVPSPSQERGLPLSRLCPTLPSAREVVVVSVLQ